MRPAPRRQPFQVEIFLELWRMVGKGDREIGRRLPQVAQGEFIFLRAIEAGRHVVHRPNGKRKERQPALDQPLGEQKVVGLHAFVGGGADVAIVEREEFVQQSRAGAPMADDENWGLVDRRPGQASAVKESLQAAK